MPPPRRGASGNALMQRSRGIRWRACAPLIGLLSFTLIAPLVLTSWRSMSSPSVLPKNMSGGNFNINENARKLSALEQIEAFFPIEMRNSLGSQSDAMPLSLSIVGRKDLSSYLVKEEPADGGKSSEELLDAAGDELPVVTYEDAKAHLEATGAIPLNGDADFVVENDTSREVRKLGMDQRQQKRLTELLRPDAEDDARREMDVIVRAREVDVGADGKFSIWKREDIDNADAMVRVMRDQLIMARAYAAIAESSNNLHLLKELKARTKENKKILDDANVDSELPSSAKYKIKQMGRLLTKARDQHRDASVMVKKLRAMLQSSEANARTLKKQSTFLTQLAAKTIPKGLHCLSMLLTVAYQTLPFDAQQVPLSSKLEDPSLYHYALFSDNILAAAVVVNSTISHAKDPERHVFHLVTDRMNYCAMKMWFLENPPSTATIQVESVDDFKWLNASYSPVLHQLGSDSMKEYYFKADSEPAASSNLKYRNPKYLSILNHLRFYLPQAYPKLDKILFLDDDVVVQRDLSGLWEVDLQGNVNGAVETCGPSFHRFDKYLNFSNPVIAENFDPMACGWAYGMNIFDLVEWKKRDITGIYHKWQRLNSDRTLWKLGTLPPGLITFYNMTQPLNKTWHVLGLGYNAGVLQQEIEQAAVVHYNGNMKPWLEIAMSRYKRHWTKYVKYDYPLLQQCNIKD